MERAYNAQMIKLVGYVIHDSEQIQKFVEKCKKVALKYDMRFKLGAQESYSWKIKGHKKVEFSFRINKKTINIGFILKFLEEITLKFPTEISWDEGVWFNYYTTPEQFGSKEYEAIFMIIGTTKIKQVVVMEEEKKLLIHKTGDGGLSPRD